MQFLGIAANKMLAKICTDVQKPNGQFQLKNDTDEITKFMNPLPIRKVQIALYEMCISG